jgi:hypothetical protein
VLDKAAEARALERGDIRVLQQTTTAIPAGSYRLPEGWLNQNEEV